MVAVQLNDVLGKKSEIFNFNLAIDIPLNGGFCPFLLDLPLDWKRSHFLKFLGVLLRLGVYLFQHLGKRFFLGLGRWKLDVWNFDFQVFVKPIEFQQVLKSVTARDHALWRVRSDKGLVSYFEWLKVG